MNENNNSHNNSIPSFVSEYEELSQNGDLGLLVVKDFLSLFCTLKKRNL
jgi:hypothetical protein